MLTKKFSYSVDDIVEFYADGQFTHGCSVDHIIFQFQDDDFELAFDDQEVSGDLK